MEKDRSARLIAIVALVLAVTGVSIGFAVLSTNLTIEAPEANVKANEKLFTIYFSGIPTSYQAPTTVTPQTSPSEDGFTGKQISVEANSTTLSGIGGTFTKPGQTITYAIGISNTSKLDGYLTSITFNNVDGDNKKVKCEPVNTNNNEIDSSEMENVCGNITVSVKVNDSDYTTDQENLNGIHIGNGQTIPFTVTIKYGDGETTTPATGDFKATFGSIVLGFKTKDNAAAD